MFLPTLQRVASTSLHSRDPYSLERMAENLRQAEEAYKSIFDNAIEGIYQSSVEGRWLRANPAFVRMNGYDTEEELLAAFSDIGAQWYVDQGARRAFKGMVERDGHVSNFEAEVYWRRTRERFWISENARAVRDGEGRVLYYEGAVVDITDRKRMEEELRQKSAHLEATFENMSEGICVVDADLNMVAWNRRFVDLFALPGSMMRPGVPFEEIVRFNASRGEYGTGDVDDLVRSHMAFTEIFEPRQYERTRRDGSVIEIRDRPLPGGGFVATFIDVSERRRAEEARIEALRRERQAEQLLVEAIESSSEGVVVYDANDRFVVANSRYLEFYPDIDDFHRPGVSYEDILRVSVDHGICHAPPGMDKEAFIQDRLASFYNPGDPIIRQMAGGRWMQFSEKRTPGGGLISVQTDITALKRRESELIDSKDAAEAANRAKSAFLANISHELRTPLHAVLGLAEVIRDNPDDAASVPTYREYAKLIHDSGSHLLELINDVLDMSKIEAGRYDLLEEDLQFGQTVDSCIAIVSQRATEGGVSVVNRVDGAVPAVRADVRAVKQIILNLLSNAVKFTPVGGSVVVSAGRDPAGDVTLSVSDTGIGIASDNLQYITEPFWQADDSHTRQYEGTGLGLAISRRLIELHGGAILVESEQGVGTTVSIRFPKERVLT